MKGLTAYLPQFLRPVANDDLLRLGSTFDGGYVIHRRMIDEAGFLLSFGLYDNWAFEAAFCKRIEGKGLACHAYDATTSLAFLAMWRPHRLISYCNMFDRKRAVHFEEYVGNPNLERTIPLSVALERVPGDEPILLKMDIEGSEYFVLEDLFDHADRFIGLVVEFHGLAHIGHHVLALLFKLSRHFDIVHVHGNNNSGVGPNGLPMTMEVTMMRKGLGADAATEPPPVLPLRGLDAPNKFWRRDINIRFVGGTEEQSHPSGAPRKIQSPG